MFVTRKAKATLFFGLFVLSTLVLAPTALALVTVPHRLSCPSRSSFRSFGSLPEWRHSTPRASAVPQESTSKQSPLSVLNSKIKAFDESGKLRLTAVCSFLTGWADVALFLRYKTFASMMTGNTMWFAQALVEQRYRFVAYYASIVVSYLVGIVVFRKTDLSLKQRTMPVCAAMVASLFVASEVLYKISGGVMLWIPVLLLALGFGIVNSVGTEVAGTLTFVVTGHMTKLTHQIVDRRLSRKQKAMDSKAVAQNTAVLLGFLGGALFPWVAKQLSLVVPMEFAVLGLLYGGLFLWQDMEALGGAWWLRKNKRLCELDDDGVTCINEEETTKG